jgi:hypothetical protein
LVLFGLLVVAALSVLAGVGGLLCYLVEIWECCIQPSFFSLNSLLKKNKIILMRLPCCLRIPPPPSKDSEWLNQSLWNLVLSRHGVWLETKFGLVTGFTGHSKNRCNYSKHKVFLVFTRRCLVAALNGGRFLSSRFPNYHRPQLPAPYISQLQLSGYSTTAQSQSQSQSQSRCYVTTDGKSASLAWC